MEEVNIKRPLYFDELVVELYSDGDGNDEDYRLDFSMSHRHPYDTLSKKQAEELYEYLKLSLGK